MIRISGRMTRHNDDIFLMLLVRENQIWREMTVGQKRHPSLPRCKQTESGNDIRNIIYYGNEPVPYVLCIQYRRHILLAARFGFMSQYRLRLALGRAAGFWFLVALYRGMSTLIHVWTYVHVVLGSLHLGYAFFSTYSKSNPLSISYVDSLVQLMYTSDPDATGIFELFHFTPFPFYCTTSVYSTGAAV